VDSPFRYVLVVIVVLVIGQFWLVRPAPFRVAAQRGAGWLALAVLASLSMLAFGIGLATGKLVIAVAALVVGAPITWFLFIRLLRDRTPPPE
jgi:hypothetical protein